MPIGSGPPEQLTLTTTGMSTAGRAVARDHAGRVVFVDGALPDERVLVEVTDRRARWATGRTIEIIDPSPHRTVPRCSRLAEGCGGCQWQHVEPAAQRSLKEGLVVDSLRRIGYIESVPMQPTVALGPWAYRTSMRVGVLDGRAALRRSRSHDLTGVEGCLVVHPLLRELLEGPRYLHATSVLLRCGARTGERLVATDPSRARADVPIEVRSDHFYEVAAGQRWRISAGSFFQTRPDGADALAALVSTAAAGMDGPATAVDLYSGVGLFAGVLAASGWKVTAVESAASSVADAETNLQALGVDVVRADVRKWTGRAADLVVADPSRDGLGRDGVAVVARTGARRVVLISCDAAAMARDSALLADRGYSISSITLVDLFPQTFRVEVVTVFDRG